MSSRYWPNSAIRRRRRTCAIACVIRYAATRAVFSLHNRQARSSAWFAPNSSHIFHTARRFAGSLVSSSRRSIVARVSVKSFLPGRPISHAKIIAQALRSPVRSIVSTRTGSTSGSDSPEPRSDSSRPYKRRATPSLRGSPLDPAATPQSAPCAVATDLFDHLVGDREQPVGNFEAERLCGLEVDRQLVLDRVLHRKVGRLVALEDAIDVTGRAPVRVGRVGGVGDEPAAGDEVGA